MHERVAYEGESFIIEWYFNETGNSQALRYFNGLSEIRQNRTLYLFKRMGDFGRINNRTMSRYEGDALFVFKPQPDRFLCFFARGKRIIVTNAFRKKSERLPRQEKAQAMRLRQDYLERVNRGAYYE